MNNNNNNNNNNDDFESRNARMGGYVAAALCALSSLAPAQGITLYGTVDAAVTATRTGAPGTGAR